MEKMANIEKRQIMFVEILIILIFFIGILMVILASYGAVQIYTYKDRNAVLNDLSDQIIFWQEKSNRQELKIETLKRCIKWEGILEPIFSSLEKAELNAIQEKVRQKIKKEFPGSITHDYQR